MTGENGHELDTCPVGIRHKDKAFGLRIGSVVAGCLKGHTADNFRFCGSDFNVVDDEGKMGQPQVIPLVIE
jgi:hypothetical protein